MEDDNKTLATEIILLGFSDDFRINIVLFLIFFSIYLVTVIGNVFMILLILISPNLQIPMYFFLCNLSFIDLFYSCSALPKLLVDLFLTERIISLLGCGIQVYISAFLGDAECLLLALMAYDRYIAICHPLHYPILMRWKVCCQFAITLWIISFFISVVPSLLIPVKVCNPNRLNHFMCEIIAIIKLSCDNIYLSQLMIFSVSFFTLLFPFLFITITYICIISSVLKIQSVERSKAFSTCSSHITVVVMFYWTAMVMYFGSSSHYSTNQEKYVAVFYAIIIPMLNPLIYSLKNREVKKAFLSHMTLSSLKCCPRKTHMF